MRTVNAADEKSVYLEGAGSTYYYIDWSGFNYPIPGYRVYDGDGKQLGVVRSARLHVDTPTPTSVYYASDVKKKTYVPSHETHDTKTFLVAQQKPTPKTYDGMVTQNFAFDIDLEDYT